MTDCCQNHPNDGGGHQDIEKVFNFWKVMAVSSLAVALVNLGLLYFITLEIRTVILSDAPVYNVSSRDLATPGVETEASDSAAPLE